MGDDEIIEINSDTNNQDIKLEIKNEMPKNNKKSIKEKWEELDKNKKILIIMIPIILVLILIFLIIYLFVFKNNDSKNNENNNNKEEIIVAKENYRYENGNLIFLDKRDQILGTYECNNKNPETCGIAKSDFSNDEFDRIKSVNENDEELFLNSNIYFDNYVFIQDGEEINLYDIDNKNIELTLNKIKIYDYASNLIVILDNNNRYGLIEINKDGYSYLIRPSYDYLGIINSNLNYLVAKDNDNTYIIDKNSKKITSNIKNKIKNVDDTYLVLESQNKYSLYSLKLEELFKDYDFISLNDHIISLVKDDKLYLLDNDLNKLNEEGLELKNTNYVKKYIYDKDNKLKETKVAYEMLIKDNILTINIDDNKKDINLIEPLINKNYTYMNYLDGILYFYSDVDKENLIGKYTCQTKNNIISKDTTLEQCSLYSNTSGISGIYNNKYVFIYDNDIIYLYDITLEKVIGTYNEIDILNASEINKNMKHIYTESSYILAKSAIGVNKDNYGILEINNTKAQGKIEFKYENITKKNNYYLMITKDKTYSIYNNSFEKISNEFSYIELYDKYYVGINDNKLNIYTYDNPLGILLEGLAVENNEFTIDFTDGFNITINNVTYKYDLEGNKNE